MERNPIVECERCGKGMKNSNKKIWQSKKYGNQNQPNGWFRSKKHISGEPDSNHNQQFHQQKHSSQRRKLVSGRKGFE
jgi:hypothetical protein